MQDKSARVNDRLYQDLARKLIVELKEGKYPVGGRLPAERELAQQYDVSRPTVREAIIALEVQGFVEVRVGSGAYVIQLPGKADIPGFDLSAFEITEARLLFEGDAAALAATQATDEELAEIAGLVDEIARENRDPKGQEKADRAFHLAIARATRNSAIFEAIERLWDLRNTSPEAALLHEKARTANVKPVLEEHTAVLRALEARDPAAARDAMRAHLAAVLDSLLFATEDKAVERARDATRAKRARYRAVAG
ncbi:MAG: FadR family transcriptional regulator [Novosphingobium sp.]|nr:FadR family transcriptional regulator [Novosphingobium sp.]